MKYLEDISEATKSLTQAEARMAELLKKSEELKEKFRMALYVGRKLPCKAAILPDGDIVVHVYSGNDGVHNQLHIVPPLQLTEGGELLEEMK